MPQTKQVASRVLVQSSLPGLLHGEKLPPTYAMFRPAVPYNIVHDLVRRALRRTLGARAPGLASRGGSPVLGLSRWRLKDKPRRSTINGRDHDAYTMPLTQSFSLSRSLTRRQTVQAGPVRSGDKHGRLRATRQADQARAARDCATARPERHRLVRQARKEWCRGPMSACACAGRTAGRKASRSAPWPPACCKPAGHVEAGHVATRPPAAHAAASAAEGHAANAAQAPPHRCRWPQPMVPEAPERDPAAHPAAAGRDSACTCTSRRPISATSADRRLAAGPRERRPARAWTRSADEVGACCRGPRSSGPGDRVASRSAGGPDRFKLVEAPF